MIPTVMVLGSAGDIEMSRNFEFMERVRAKSSKARKVSVTGQKIDRPSAKSDLTKSQRVEQLF